MKNAVYYKIVISHHIEEGKALSSLDRGFLEQVGVVQGRERECVWIWTLVLCGRLKPNKIWVAVHGGHIFGKSQSSFSSAFQRVKAVSLLGLPSLHSGSRAKLPWKEDRLAMAEGRWQHRSVSGCF